jgi:hypothetical protein
MWVLHFWIGLSTNYLQLSLGDFHKFKIILKHNMYIHSYDILGEGMLWKPKEARILTNFIDQPVNIGKHSHTKNALTRCFTNNFTNFKVQNEECHYYVYIPW